MPNEWWRSFPSPDALDREAIAALLPHRGHMALLDRAAPGPEGCWIGEVLIRAEAFWAAGHFPVPAVQENPRFAIGPIFPGVLMVESAAQLGILHWRHAAGLEDTRGKLMLFKEIRETDFKKEVRPGAVLLIRSVMEKCGRRLMRCSFEGVSPAGEAGIPVFTCAITGLAA